VGVVSVWYVCVVGFVFVGCSVCVFVWSACVLYVGVCGVGACVFVCCMVCVFGVWCVFVLVCGLCVCGFCVCCGCVCVVGMPVVWCVACDMCRI